MELKTVTGKVVFINPHKINFFWAWRYRRFFKKKPCVCISMDNGRVIYVENTLSDVAYKIRFYTGEARELKNKGR